MNVIVEEIKVALKRGRMVRIPSLVDEPVTGFDDANEMNDVHM